jgi:hypothetical protein
MYRMSEAFCFLAAFGLFLTGVSPTVSFEDTGELVWAAWSLGVTHPPGYPWLTMLSRLFLLLPLGDPGFRAGVMSAVFGAAAVTAVFSMVRIVSLAGDARARSDSAIRSGTAAVLAAGALAFSKTLWWQASIPDKYTLSLALMCLSLLVLLRAWVLRRPRTLALAVFLAGTALSHHLHGLYLIPVVLIAVWRLKPSAARILLLGILFSLPLLGKTLAIPIRSAANPEINWGLPDRADRLTYYLAARQYRFIMLASKGPAETAGRALRQATVLPLAEFGPALALAAPGLAALRAIPGLGTGVSLVLAANFGFAVSYDTPEIERYYLLSYAVLAVLIGLGGARLVLAGPAAPAPGAGRPALAMLAVLAALAVPAWRNAATSPRRGHYLAWDFAVNQLAPLPAGSVLICEGDDQAFPLFYARYVMRFREDVTILPMPFACWKPAYERLGPQLPGLNLPSFVPDPGRHLPAIIAANPDRPFYYTPGCSGAGSERFLVPRGTVFAAFPDPVKATAARREYPPLPALRLRGAVESGAYGDSVTTRAVCNYGMAFAFHGAQAIERGDYAAAERDLSRAVRLPMNSGTLAAAETHLALVSALNGKPERCEGLYRRAIKANPDFGPALFGLGRLLLARDRDIIGARPLLERAARAPQFLNARERTELAVILGKIR